MANVPFYDDDDFDDEPSDWGDTVDGDEVVDFDDPTLDYGDEQEDFDGSYDYDDGRYDDDPSPYDGNY